MLDFLTKFLRREESSRSLAKERLRLVLLSDRIALTPDTFDAMKAEMLSVVQRYLDIDERGLDVHFENAERRFMLRAFIPVRSVKSNEQMERERQRRAVGGNGVHPGTSGGRRRRRRRRHRNGPATSAQHPQPTSAQPLTQENVSPEAPIEPNQS